MTVCESSRERASLSAKRKGVDRQVRRFTPFLSYPKIPPGALHPQCQFLLDAFLTIKGSSYYHRALCGILIVQVCAQMLAG